MRKLTVVVLLLFILVGAGTVVQAGSDNQRIANLENQVAQLRSRISDRNETIETLRERNGELRSRLDERNATINTLRQRLEQRNNTINDLRARLGHTDANPENGQYRVVSGDTLYQIAKRFEVAFAELVAANNLKAPYNLEIGQVLEIPTDEDDVTSYTVKHGETVWSIAADLDANWVEIINHNEIKAPYWLEIGQVLEIPQQ